jgi:hypothetical protein
LSVDYELIHDEPEVARIFSKQQQIGELRNVAKGLFRLTDEAKSWLLNRKIDGTLLPFSMLISEERDSKEILKVKDHLFPYNAYFYMIGGIPESQNPKDHLRGYKYIIRITNFPHTQHEQIDEETLSRLKRHRGVPVGRIHGLGSKGFYLKIEDELKDIGLPLAAATYLMYSTA